VHGCMGDASRPRSPALRCYWGRRRKVGLPMHACNAVREKRMGAGADIGPCGLATMARMSFGVTATARWLVGRDHAHLLF
jgi:hypothetical protein